PAVDKVYDPGLKAHVNHEIAAQQQSAFGGIVTFTLKNDTEDAAKKVVCNTKLFKLAESLGGVKSLLCHPATMTHKSIPAEKRRAAGVQDSLVRLSVGLEQAADLKADIVQALDKLNKAVQEPRVFEYQ
ncbi:partial Cystathionine beta-lyase, partial [Methylococcales bacterium]